MLVGLRMLKKKSSDIEHLFTFKPWRGIGESPSKDDINQNPSPLLPSEELAD